MTATSPDRIDPPTIRAWLDRPDAVTVLDVRTPAEFETAHLRGAYNVPLNLLDEHAEQIAARLDRQVVLVCGSGARAERARRRLAGVGADRVHVLDGGMAAYTAAVGDDTLVRRRARWGLERQVRLVAGALVLAGLTVGLRLPAARMLSGRRRGRPGRFGAHRHVHDGAAAVRAALQPRCTRPHPRRGPRRTSQGAGGVSDRRTRGRSP